MEEIINMKEKIKFKERMEINNDRIMGKNREFRHLHTTREDIHIYSDMDFNITIELTDKQLASDKIIEI
jgi:hypothetical protein